MALISAYLIIAAVVALGADVIDIPSVGQSQLASRRKARMLAKKVMDMFISLMTFLIAMVSEFIFIVLFV